MVDTNIGAFEIALQAALKAVGNINHGPLYDTAGNIVDFNPDAPMGSSGDWGLRDSNPDAFIMAIHKWGDTTKRVSK